MKIACFFNYHSWKEKWDGVEGEKKLFRDCQTGCGSWQVKKNNQWQWGYQNKFLGEKTIIWLLIIVVIAILFFEDLPL